MARALTQGAAIPFVSEPTRGIDTGAKQLVLNLLAKMSRERGTSIIMTSSEPAELSAPKPRIKASGPANTTPAAIMEQE